MSHSGCASPLELRARREGAAVVVELVGELDLATEAAAADGLAAAMEQAAGPVVVDAASLGFCDARGIAVLLGAARLAAGRRLPFGLAGASALLARSLRIVGVHEAFPMFATCAAAVESLGGGSGGAGSSLPEPAE
ncbi:MAG: STAS domain-containing protein [Acidimicrobiales bacterium]